MNKIKLIIFDLDYTLITGPEANSFYGLYSRALERVLAEKLEMPIDGARRIADYFRENYDGQGELSFPYLRLNLNYLYDAFCEFAPERHLAPLSSNRNILLLLNKQGYRLGIITNSPTLLAKKILKAAEIEEDLFEFIIGWERDEGFPKEDSGKIFKEVVRRANLKPQEVVMIGDSIRTDILPARKAGLHAIQVPVIKYNKQML